MSDQLYLTAPEVADTLRISVVFAYKIMRECSKRNMRSGTESILRRVRPTARIISG